MHKRAANIYQSARTLGYWELFADAASLAWCDTQPHLIMPQIHVHIEAIAYDSSNNKLYNELSTQQTDALRLNYLLTLPHDISQNSALPWFTWLPLKLKPKTADYLWQSTCLECFIAGESAQYKNIEESKDIAQNTQYIEINVSSNGDYALYHFEDYRTPDITPPQTLMLLPLLQNLQRNRLIDLQPTIDAHYLSKTRDAQIINNSRVFARQITLQLSPLAKLWNKLTYIHPAVILQEPHSQQHLYFAPKHTTPPDFHLSKLWTPINLTL